MLLVWLCIIYIHIEVSYIYACFCCTQMDQFCFHLPFGENFILFLFLSQGFFSITTCQHRLYCHQPHLCINQQDKPHFIGLLLSAEFLQNWSTIFSTLLSPFAMRTALALNIHLLGRWFQFQIKTRRYKPQPMCGFQRNPGDSGQEDVLFRQPSI